MTSSNSAEGLACERPRDELVCQVSCWEDVPIAVFAERRKIAAKVERLFSAVPLSCWRQSQSDARMNCVGRIARASSPRLD